MKFFFFFYFLYLLFATSNLSGAFAASFIVDFRQMHRNVKMLALLMFPMLVLFEIARPPTICGSAVPACCLDSATRTSPAPGRMILQSPRLFRSTYEWRLCGLDSFCTAVSVSRLWSGLHFQRCKPRCCRVEKARLLFRIFHHICFTSRILFRAFISLAMSHS